MRRLIVMGLGGLALCLGGSAPDRHAAFTTRAFAAARLPDVFVWAWERSEDLSFLDPRRIGLDQQAMRIAVVEAVAMRLSGGHDFDCRWRAEKLAAG